MEEVNRYIDIRYLEAALLLSNETEIKDVSYSMSHKYSKSKQHPNNRIYKKYYSKKYGVSRHKLVKQGYLKKTPKNKRPDISSAVRKILHPPIYHTPRHMLKNPPNPTKSTEGRRLPMSFFTSDTATRAVDIISSVTVLTEESSMCIILPPPSQASFNSLNEIKKYVRSVLSYNCRYTPPEIILYIPANVGYRKRDTGRITPGMEEYLDYINYTPPEVCPIGLLSINDPETY